MIDERTCTCPHTCIRFHPRAMREILLQVARRASIHDLFLLSGLGKVPTVVGLLSLWTLCTK
jgi:hypothetical protein